jgi:hypothetical protein
MAHKLTTAEINQQLSMAGRLDVLMTGPNHGANTHADFKCTKCQSDFKASPSSVKMGTGCPSCAKKTVAWKRRLSTSEVERRLLERKIQLLTPHSTMHVRVAARCLVCGGEWRTLASGLLRAKSPSGCPACSKKKTSRSRRLTHEQVQAQISSVQPNVVMAGKYINDSTRVKARCLLDGCEWFATPSHLKRDTGCPECARFKQHADSVENLVCERLRMNDRPCSFYLYELAGIAGYVKPGISCNVERRKREGKGYYGDLLACWDFETRADALALELGFLQGTKAMKAAPYELDSTGWQGVTELRRLESQAAIDFAQALVDELQQVGWQSFLLERYPLPIALKRKLQERRTT